MIRWVGSFLGLFGAFLISRNAGNWYNFLGFVAFLLSNFCWLRFGFKTKDWAMVVMQLGFTYTSFAGIYNYLS